VGGDVPKAIVEAFGGVVISQPAPKSYEILSAGIADGIMFPTESLKSFNIASRPYTTFVGRALQLLVLVREQEGLRPSEG
jgi:hypothetical protein